MFDCAFLVGLRVLRLAKIAGSQVTALHVLPIPALERVLGRVAELANGQADSFAQFDLLQHYFAEKRTKN